jgi:hypothetical protein
MGLEQRVGKLEQTLDAGGMCPHGFDLRDYTSESEGEDAAERDPRPPKVCDTCGREQRIIEIVYTKDWRGGDLEHEFRDEN